MINKTFGKLLIGDSHPKKLQTLQQSFFIVYLFIFMMSGEGGLVRL